MEQPKVFEFAKEIGMETLALMDKIREWKLPVKSHMAFLDTKLMEEIRTRLAAEHGSVSTPAKKKPVRKAAPAKSAAAPAETKKPEPSKTVAKKVVAKKAAPVVKKAVAPVVSQAVEEEELNSSNRKGQGVIRRKAGELEEKAKAQAEQEAIAQAIAAQNREAVEEELPPASEMAAAVVVEDTKGEVVSTQQSSVSGTPSAPAGAARGPSNARIISRPAPPPVVVAPPVMAPRKTHSDPVIPRPFTRPGQVQTQVTSTSHTSPAAAAAAAASSAGQTTGSANEAPRRPRGNIVGRMDLRRVVTPQQNRSEGGGGFQGGGNQGFNRGPRPTGAAPARAGLRTGFVAPAPMVETTRVEDEKERIAREDRERKKRVTNKEEEQVFSASEFRKREVIFQPKKKKPIVGRDAKKTVITVPKASKRVVKIENTIKVGEFASALNIKAPVLIKKLMMNGVMATISTDLDFDTASLIAPEFGYEAVNVYKTADELVKEIASGDLDAERVERPPVVTVMGHVDHGKTTLLDAIRNANVATGEAGGITQHIGAYTVTLEDGVKTTFIDTPGHEAFTAMRARGANVTDIAVIVVAADDGMMPQTAEAINHAKAAGVPIIVAINKMDRPGANPDRIKQQLTEFELVPEEWGGTTIYCPVSALKREGIKELLEQIHLVAEVQELRANPKRSSTGVVIESRMDKGRGAVATLLIKDGTLKIGDDIVAGSIIGRVRSMMNDQGAVVKEALPGYAVEIMGLPMPPQAGDYFDVCADEEMAAKLAEERKAKVATGQPNSKMSLEQLFAKVKTNDQKEFAFILKADVAGSLEAVKGMIEKAGTSEVKPKLIHSAIGGITESDILLSSTAKGTVIGFNVRPDGEATRVAKEKGVNIRTYSIIYELIDDLKKMMSGMLDPVMKEKQMGRAEVRNTFVVPKIGTIAGTFVVDGKIARGNQLRLVRDGRIVYEGKLSSLKRFKDDAKEVAQGFECGIGIENFNDIKVGDVIEAFIVEQVTREL